MLQLGLKNRHTNFQPQDTISIKNKTFFSYNQYIIYYFEANTLVATAFVPNVKLFPDSLRKWLGLKKMKIPLIVILNYKGVFVTKKNFFLILNCMST